mmetsp:Transcript_41039/g.80973  ORF Transcript_41039/g.80973 Transcript_41039/m.80973 type:complete len:118 (-) Transcript_41039:428-781(-)
MVDENLQNQYNELVTAHPQLLQLILQVMAFEYTIDDDGNLTIIEFTVQPAEVHRVDNDDASDYSEEEEESGDDDASDYSEGRNNNCVRKKQMRVHMYATALCMLRAFWRDELEACLP